MKNLITLLLAVLMPIFLIVRPAFGLDPIMFGTGKHDTAAINNAITVNVVNFGASGLTQTTTGKITAGSNHLCLIPPINFKKGEGVVIYHAGALPTIAPPTAATATAKGVTGNTTISYAVTALNHKGGCTASFSFSLANANATLSRINHVELSVKAVINAAGYAWYRTAKDGTSPATTGYLGITAGTTLKDTGLPVLPPPGGLPTLAPTSSLGDELDSTVVSSKGTNIVLSNPALNSACNVEVIHNDTLPVQNTISSLSTTGGTVVFPSGTYNLHSTISVTSNVNIELRKNAVIRWLDLSPANPIFLFSGVSRSSITGGRIIGDSNNQLDPAYASIQNGIDVSNSNNIEVNDVEINDTAASAIFVEQGSHDVTIEGNYIHDLGDQTHESMGVIATTSSYNVLVDGNRLSGNMLYDLYAIDVNNVTFRGNALNGGTYGIVLESGTVDTSHCTNIKVIDNNICDDIHGIHVEYNNQPVSGNVFANNYIEGTAEYGIYFNVSGSGDIIQGNKVTNFGGRGIVTGVTNFDSDPTVVRDNEVWDGKSGSIAMAPTGFGTIVENNRIWDDRTIPTTNWGMQIENGSNEIIRNNTISNMLQYGFVFDYNDNGFTFTGNKATESKNLANYEFSPSIFSFVRGNYDYRV